MKNCIIMASLFLSIAASSAVYAQQRLDYLGQAGVGAVLYRAPEAPKLPYGFEGTQYVYSEKFEEGTLRYNDVTYSGISLNLNANADELHIMVPTSMVVLELDKRWVEWFTMGEKKFIAAGGKNRFEGLQEGYYQILHNGEGMLLKKHIKRIKVTKHEVKGIYREFEPLERYYAVKDGVAFQVARKGDLMKLYAGQKRAVKEMLKKSGGTLNGKENRERLFTAIMKVVDK